MTDCLNFGSPEDPEIMWQFGQTVEGLSSACVDFGIPVTGGNVSMYNQTGTTAIHPTPVVGVLGVFDDVGRATPSGWRLPGQTIYLLGTTADDSDGSAWADVVHGHLGGVPPQYRPDAERGLAEILINASRDGMIDAAHDLSEGGLAQALVESSLRWGAGARVWLTGVARARRDRPLHGAVLRIDGACDRRGAAQRRGALLRHVHGSPLPVRADRHDRYGR